MKKLIFLLMILGFQAVHSQSYTLSINPQTCILNPGQSTCSVNATWTSSNATNVCLWRKSPTLTPAKFSCMTNATNLEYPYVDLAGRTLELRHGSLDYNQSTLFEAVNVTAVTPSGNLTVNPSTCQLQPGQTLCSVFASWTSSYATDVCLWRLGAGLTPAKVSCSTNGNNVEYAYASVDGKTLELRYGSQTYAQSTLLDSITVYAIPPQSASGDLSVNSTTCDLQAGNTECSVFASWTSSNASQVCLWAFGPSSAPAQVSCAVSGNNIEYSEVDETGKTLELRHGSSSYNQSTLLDSVQVSANPAPSFDLLAEINNAANGATINIPAGTYYIDAGIVINKSLKLLGDSSGPIDDTKIVLNSCANPSGCLDTTVIRFEGTASNPLDFAIIKHVAVVSEGLQFSQSGQTNPSDGIGIRFTYVNKGTLRNVSVENTARANVAIKNSNNIKVLFSEFKDSGFGVYLPTNEDPRNHRADPNIWISNTTNINIFNFNLFIGRNNGPGGDGSLDIHDSNVFSIKDNSFVNTGADAIYLMNTHNGVVENNHIENGNENGLSMGNGSSQIVFRHNTVCGITSSWSSGIVSPGLLHNGPAHTNCPTLIRVEDNNIFSTTCGLNLNTTKRNPILWGVRTGGKDPGIDIVTPCPVDNNWDGVCFDNPAAYELVEPFATCTYN